MAITQIDIRRQTQDATLNKAKLEADFLEGGDLNLTNAANNATITGLRDGTAASQDASTVKQMEDAIAAAITGGMTYKGVIDASVATGIALDGAAAGDFYVVSVAGTLNGIAFSIGDHLVVNAAITDFSVDGAGKIDKVDNTESLDILRDADVQNNLTTSVAGSVLDATQGKALKDTADALEVEVEAIKTGAGLDAGGTYTPDATADYISGATSLKNADSLLDDQIKVNTDGVAAIEAGLGRRAFNEKPVVTNASAIVTLANTLVEAGSERVYLNGIRMNSGAGNDYTMVASTGVITFAAALKSPKDVVIVDYEYNV